VSSRAVIANKTRSWTTRENVGQCRFEPDTAKQGIIKSWVGGTIILHKGQIMNNIRSRVQIETQDLPNVKQGY
jgi:hypothetical protein